MKKLFFILCLMFSFSSSFAASHVDGKTYEMNGVQKELIQELPEDDIEKYWFDEQYFNQNSDDKYMDYIDYMRSKYKTITPEYNVITPDGKMNYLLIEFEDNEKVLSSFFTEYNTLIISIGEKNDITYQPTLNSLKELNDYVNLNYDIILPDFNEFKLEEFMSELSYVIDIAENKDENTTRKDLLASINKQRGLSDTEKLSKLEESGFEVPFVDSEFTTDVEKEFTSGAKQERANDVSTGGGFSITSATNYATRYASNHNTSTYGSFDKDCTNFASQIMKAGGAKEQSTSNKNNWWHNKSSSKHYYGNRWIRADAFTKYFGVDYKYSKWSSVVSKARQGDFLAADFSKDGTYDHVGYVSYKSCKNNVCQLKVAQHTSDYNKYSHGWKNTCDKGYCSIVRK